jgi:hypothetical protein
MTRTIYALKSQVANDPQNFEPLFPFEQWDEFHIPDSALDAINAGENVDFAPNPHYIPHASFDIEDDDAEALFCAIGYPFKTETKGQGLLYSVDILYDDVGQLISLHSPTSVQQMNLDHGVALFKLIEKARAAGAFYFTIL